MITLQGTLFTLREWKLSDESSLVKYANNANVSRYLADRFHYPYTVDDAKEWLDLQTQKTTIDNFAIDINGEVVGGIGVEMRTDIFHKTAILGYWLAEPFWGKGMMTEAVKLMAKYCFESFDVMRIQAGTFDCNPASMQVLQKAGFVKEGVSKKALFKHGQIYDEHIFAITKP